MIIRQYILGTEDLIIRKLKNRTSYGEYDSIHKGVIIDTETTGMTEDDVPIEITLLPFWFDNEGNIGKVDPVITQLQEPLKPLEEKITLITGITDEMLQDKKFDKKALELELETADVIIAHNAQFDHNMMKKVIKLPRKIWACTANDIPWNSEYNISSAKLEYLAFCFGFYYEAHRAEVDCRAVLELISLKIREQSIFQKLISIAFQPDFKINAWRAPFEKKDLLKARGYYWNPDDKVWWKKFKNKDDIEFENEWMQQNIYDFNFEAELVCIDPEDRYL